MPTPYLDLINYSNKDLGLIWELVEEGNKVLNLMNYTYEFCFGYAPGILLQRMDWGVVYELRKKSGILKKYLAIQAHKNPLNSHCIKQQSGDLIETNSLSTALSNFVALNLFLFPTYQSYFVTLSFFA